MLGQLERAFPDRHWQGYAVYRRGYTYSSMDLTAEAVLEYRRCLEDYPDNPYCMLVKQLLKQAEERLETELVEDALELAPDFGAP